MAKKTATATPAATSSDPLAFLTSLPDARKPKADSAPRIAIPGLQKLAEYKLLAASLKAKMDASEGAIKRIVLDYAVKTGFATKRKPVNPKGYEGTVEGTQQLRRHFHVLKADQIEVFAKHGLDSKLDSKPDNIRIAADYIDMSVPENRQYMAAFAAFVSSGAVPPNWFERVPGEKWVSDKTIDAIYATAKTPEALEELLTVAVDQVVGAALDKNADREAAFRSAITNLLINDLANAAKAAVVEA